jgi:hypothetical protein
MSSITILHHLGLGDQIMLNGMVRHFAEHENVNIFVKQNHEKSVKFMYKDIRDRVNIIPLDNINHLNIRSKIPPNSRVLQLATYGMDDNMWKMYTSATNWAHGVYLQAKVNPYYMYSKFKIIRDTSSEIQLNKSDYIFIHDDHERNLHININSDKFIYRPYSKIVDKENMFFESNNYNIFDYVSLIENATEVHCIDSSYAWLVEMMKLGNKSKNFLHISIKGSYRDDIVKTVYNDQLWTFI